MVRAYDLELVRASIIVSILVSELVALNQHARGYLNHVCLLRQARARKLLKIEGFHWLAPALEVLEG